MIQGVVAFDLDGTLLRGDTACEVLARRLGKLSKMKQFERLHEEADIEAARVEMAEWYNSHEIDALRGFLQLTCWAPGAREAVLRLQENNVKVVIASLTWRFVVQWFAEQLSVEHYLGTDMAADGQIAHV